MRELNEWGEIEEAAEYQGRKVTLNKPFYTPDGPKKSSVYVKNDKGNVIKVNFGDPNMEIKRDDPERKRGLPCSTSVILIQVLKTKSTLLVL